MTYVTDQTSQELRAHMRRLKAMKGWNEPLSDRLYKEILELDKEVSKLRAAQAAQPAPRRLTEAEITLLVEAYYEDVGIAPPDLIRQVEGLIFGDAQAAHAHAIDTSPERVEKQAGDVQVPGWLPIESAPKDGSRILIYTPSSRQQVQEVWWAIEYEGATRGYWQTPTGPMGRGYMILPESANLWQPLPAAPSTKEGQQ